MISLFLKKTLAKWWAGVFLFVMSIGIDQWTKNRAMHVFENHDFAFSLPLPAWLMFLIYFVVIGFMVFYCLKNYRKFNFAQQAGWVLIFSGAISNIAERLAQGFVRDFIYINFLDWTGVYNLADFYIIAGILLLLFIPKPKDI